MPRRVDKPWGHEEIWAETERYVGKILAIRRDARLSLQYHQLKDESIRVLSGRMRLELEDDAGAMVSTELGAGQSARIPTGRKHRFTALEDCELVEVSTPELDDVVRIDDDYGRTAAARGS
jgi:mannose-6-phosphate isomerase-like protein (cupin superfamily)